MCGLGSTPQPLLRLWIGVCERSSVRVLMQYGSRVDNGCDHRRRCPNAISGSLKAPQRLLSYHQHIESRIAMSRSCHSKGYIGGSFAEGNLDKLSNHCHSRGSESSRRFASKRSVGTQYQYLIEEQRLAENCVSKFQRVSEANRHCNWTCRAVIVTGEERIAEVHRFNSNQEVCLNSGITKNAILKRPFIAAWAVGGCKHSQRVIDTSKYHCSNDMHDAYVYLDRQMINSIDRLSGRDLCFEVDIVISVIIFVVL